MRSRLKCLSSEQTGKITCRVLLIQVSNDLAIITIIIEAIQHQLPDKSSWQFAEGAAAWHAVIENPAGRNPAYRLLACGGLPTRLPFQPVQSMKIRAFSCQSPKGTPPYTNNRHARCRHACIENPAGLYMPGRFTGKWYQRQTGLKLGTCIPKKSANTTTSARVSMKQNNNSDAVINVYCRVKNK